MQSIDNMKNETLSSKHIRTPKEELQYFEPENKIYDVYFKCPQCEHKYYIG